MASIVAATRQHGLGHAPFCRSQLGLHIILMAAIGLVIGSFVNVLIHRIPQMILRADESGPIGLNLSSAPITLPSLPPHTELV